MPIDKTPWTDTTKIPWGKYRGELLKNVPADYLLWLLKQDWIKKWPGLLDYLKKHEDQLISEQAETETEDAQAEGYNSYEDYLRYR